jgi:hypothetical protein
MRLLTGAVFALAFCNAANSGQGPCGLEVGLWASSKAACQYANNRREAAERFGQNVFLQLEAKAYQASEARCSIRSARLNKKSCKLSVTCTSEKGKKEDSEVEFYIRKPDQVMVNLVNLYEHCRMTNSGQ